MKRLFKFETVLTLAILSVGNDCFVLVACKYNETFLSYFFVEKIPLSRRVGYVMDGSVGQ